MGQLENKVAIVTGGASGIGKAIVKLFVEKGAKVIVADVNEVQGKDLVNNLGNGNAIFIKADTAIPEDNKKIVELAVESFGRLDIAVNNAGIGGDSVPTGDYPIDTWKRVIDINLNGVFYAMHYQLPELEKTNGAIINMASILGSVGFANASAYVAAKHGVVGLTKTAAWEYGERGVRVNAVGPGFISTPLLDDMSADTVKYLEGQHAMNRLGTAEEVANLSLWLVSDAASFVTGSYYPVDGGYLAK